MRRPNDINKKRDHRSKHPHSRSSCTLSSWPHSSCPRTSAYLGGNFQTSVAIRMSRNTCSHICMEKNSDICTCQHLPAFQRVAFPTGCQSVVCWTFHGLQSWKRCSCVCSAPPLHNQHMLSSRCPNRVRQNSVMAYPLLHLDNLAASAFTHLIGTDLLLPASPFRLYL